MRKAPLVAAINDLSGFGRCSLTVAMPILSVMGLQCCPLPTSILSNHTGYESYYFKDFTDDMSPYIAEWQKLGLEFSAVFTGFLGSAKQADIVCEFIRDVKKQKNEKPLIFVDPVMGDNGSAYATCDTTLCESMKKLVGQADVITPNITEACLLLGRDYCGERIDEAKALKLVKALAELGSGKVVLTGVRSKVGTVANLAYDSEKNHFYWVEEPAVEPFYNGAGDVFSSVLCGYLMTGQDMQSALEKAAFFVYVAAKNTAAAGGTVRDGIMFEKYLKML
jgi:pyridoxine kinase